MQTLKVTSKCLLSGLFILAGVNHFLRAAFYVRIMPPYVPWHYFMVYLSGALEIAFGITLLVPVASHWAAWGLIALLVAVFPANIHMALHTKSFPEFSAALLWVRLPFQVLLILWAYWHTHDSRKIR